MRQPAAPAGGFTLIELQVVIALIAILGGMAVVSIQSALTAVRGDSAMSQVTSTLRVGRDAAIAQRRSVDVVFAPPNRIQLQRNDLPGGQTPLADVALEYGAQFVLDPTVPDTPDGFGRSAAVDFGDAVTVRFLADGTLADETGVPINGTIFLQRPGELASARAVTLTGGSGRAQAYRWMGRVWEAR